MGNADQPLSREVNEGIRISAIVTALRAVREGRSAAAVEEALFLWNSALRTGGDRVGVMSKPASGSESQKTDPGAGTAMRRNDDGSITWTFPIEISVAAPLISCRALAPTEQPADKARPGKDKTTPRAESASWKTEDFSNRGGYEPGFIHNFVLPLPGLDKVTWRAAENRLAEAGDDPHELRYHHFSIVMNADRRLAGFTAVNIDGALIKAIIRDTKTVIHDPSLADLGIESLGGEGAEASDDFRPDRRILPEEQMIRKFYEKQKVAGFEEPSAPARIARIFQKGHIVLRGDPAWGPTDEVAVKAERDTFFYTNAAPQVGFFKLNRPGSKGKLRWRAVESYVLRNAVTMRKRVTVFAGPVFDDDKDPEYRFESRLPMRFWKIAVWSDGQALRAIALLADQRPVLKIMPEALGPEAFADSEELARVTEFLSTVQEIETLTRLDFGAAIRKADIRSGRSSPVPALDLDPQALQNPPAGGGSDTRGRSRRPKKS